MIREKILQENEIVHIWEGIQDLKAKISEKLSGLKLSKSQRGKSKCDVQHL